MNKREKTLTAMFVLVMLVFSLLMAAWVPLRSALDFSIADISLSLETSHGRERKQQMEYNQVLEALPKAQAELAEVQPQADAAAEQVRRLKEERKALRAKKKQMEDKREFSEGADSFSTAGEEEAP